MRRLNEVDRPGRDLLILAAGVLPALLLGIAWMQQTGIPKAVYLQNAAAAIVGAVVAVFGSRRRASPRAGIVIAAVAIVLLAATLATAGVQNVHRWIRLGPLTLHVAALVIPIVLVEAGRFLRDRRLGPAFAILAIVTAILALQPDAGQATAFAGAAVVLVMAHEKRKSVAIAALLVLLALAAASFLRSDPLAPVAHVEEIAMRIAQRGVVWNAAVILALALLIVPFVAPQRTTHGLAIAVYLALSIAASYWGSFPVPILGYGMSPILGYVLGWTWLRATESVPTHDL